MPIRFFPRRNKSVQLLNEAANFRPINTDQPLNRELVCGKQAKRAWPP